MVRFDEGEEVKSTCFGKSVVMNRPKDIAQHTGKKETPQRKEGRIEEEEEEEEGNQKIKSYAVSLQALRKVMPHASGRTLKKSGSLFWLQK